MKTLTLVSQSFVRFIGLLRHNALHLRHDRLGQQYVIGDKGTFVTFRETVSNQPGSGQPVVLIVGFRLKLLRTSPLLHWLFQRICILTTPFWSGFPGFHIKLWMVDSGTKNYLGIYDWYGQENAERYVAALTKILQPLSTPGSVWHTIETTKLFENYLGQRLGP